jgi:hypothetical protein
VEYADVTTHTLARTAAAAAFFGALALSACGGKNAAPSRDASRSIDGASRLDGSLDGDDDATDTEDGGGLGDATFDTGTVTPHDSGIAPPQCSGPDNCNLGHVCCATFGGFQHNATCVQGKTCSAGYVAICGPLGGEPCASGSCQKFNCTLEAPHTQVSIYACEAPSGSNITCFAAPEAGPPGEGGTDSGS